MSTIYDGTVKSDSLAKNKTIRSSLSSDEDYGAFRGFNKFPIISLKRIKFTNYINEVNRNSFNSVKEKLKPPCFSVGLEGIGHERLLRECSVSLVRMDLEKMKDTSTMNYDYEDKVRCKICKKVYTQEKRLLTHQRNKHQIIYKTPNGKTEKRVSFSDRIVVHELKEYHKCRKCTEIFDDYKKLKSHMKETHKKRNCYICSYCSKMFMDRMFFKVHMKMHCNTCGQLFTTKKEIQAHRDNKCGDVEFKKHKCKDCDCSFFKFIDLEDHSHEHLHENYVCNKCKHKFSTKCLLAHHISFLHTKKRRRPKTLYKMKNLGSERLYLCNFCEESSVERDSIEKHVEKLPDLTNRVIRGRRDYYVCDECQLKFNTENEMLSHKWTHYLKTTDKSQNSEIGKLPLKEIPIKIPFNVHEEVPDFMRPRVMLEYMKNQGKPLEDVNFMDMKSLDVNCLDMKKAIVDKKSKKTLISKFKCETCGKYYSSNYCLNRHIETMHSDYESLKCKVCEETFVWPSLLKTHKCIRLHTAEMPFDDARPEIFFDNLHEITPNGFDNLNIDCDDYTHVDFEIPEPIVELEECDKSRNSIAVSEATLLPTPQGVGYKIVQELPIEF